MKFSSLAGMAATGALFFIVCGCGDTFRPVASPLPTVAPDPQTFRLAVFTSTAPSGQGSATDVDVSGDTISAVTPVGTNPVFALAEATRVLVADQGSDSVTSFLPSLLAISGQSTTALPTGAAPVSLADVNGNIYVAESGRGVVGVLTGSPLALSAEVPTGTTPVSLAGLANGTKVYAVNQGSNSVTSISTRDNTVFANIPVGTTPVWTVASADSTRVYVVNKGSGTVTAIDATTDTPVANAGNPVTVGSSPNYAFFDSHLQRVLVTNSGSNSVSVINADPTSPNYLSVTNVAVGSNPVSVTALADGTRSYVANQGSNNVSVINNSSLTVSKTIPIGTAPVSIASDAESAKVITANSGSQDLSVILTSSDTELLDSNGNRPLKAPQVDSSCVGATCSRQTPNFVAIGPG